MQAPSDLAQRDQACASPDVVKDLPCTEPLKPCSPANGLCDTSKSNDMQKQDQQFSAQECALPLDAVRKHLTCQLCNELVAASLVMQCSHVFCGECLYNYLNTKAQCPTCQVQLRAIPVRCLSLDAVTSAYVAKMDSKHQASFRSRTEDGRHAANKMNKMFWWLQSSMAVPGAETSDNGMVHMPHHNNAAQPTILGSNSAASQPLMQHLSPAAAAAAVLGGMTVTGQPNSMIPTGAPNRARTPCLPGAMNQCLPPQPRHSSSFTSPGLTERVSRPSQDGNPMMNGHQVPSMGFGLHRRNSEGSGMPAPTGYPPRHNGNASMAPALSGRRSFCNGEALPAAPTYATQQLPSSIFSANFMPQLQAQSAALMNHSNPFLSAPPLPSATLNALAELHKQYNAGTFMNDYTSASIGNLSAPTLQEQAIAQLIMHQQQMYLG